VRIEDGLLARACETLAGYLALGNETIASDRARFVRNRAASSIYDANHGTRVRAESEREIEAVLSAAEELFAGFGHRRFDCDPFTRAAFEARLVLEGYREEATLQLILEGSLRASPPRVEIRLARGDADWRILRRLIRLDHQETAEREQRPVYAESVSRQMTEVKRAKCPPLRFWIAQVGEVDAGFLSSWPGENGVGLVEDLFTVRELRRRGIAAALMVRAVEDARERGADLVLIGARPADSPRHIYASMGFRPLCVTRSYLKTLAAGGRSSVGAIESH
jgi:GNAT superfamily N-acetyltransferase